MNFILSILKEISKVENINIYIVGQYIVKNLLGKHSREIDILIKDKFIHVINTIIKKEEFKDYIKNDRGDLFQIIDKHKNIIINLIPMKDLSLEESLKNRLFTLDSMAIDINNFETIEPSNIIDSFGGLEDIKSEIVKLNSSEVCIHKLEDVLKAIRLMSEYNFDLDQQTKELIIKHNSSIKIISQNIVTQEVFKILKLRRTNYYFKYMDEELNILHIIFPEIKEMKEVGECKYHVVDVMRHSLYTMKVLERIIYSTGYFEDHIKSVYEKHSQKEITEGHNRLEIMKLVAFFHDVGKPSAMKIDKTGRTRFGGHEITGAEVIRNIAERLGLSIKEKDLLYKLVAEHMIPLILYKKNDVSGKALYNMFSKLEEDTLDVLLIALADIIATRKLLNPTEEMGKFKVHVEYIANNYLTRFKEIEDISNIIRGKDIIMNFEIDEGTMIDDLIEEVRKAIYNGKIEANKESALSYIEKIL